MHRVLYVFLPRWPIDRLRRAGLLPNPGAAPAKEAPLATVIAAKGRQFLAAVNPAASAKGIAQGMPLADALSFLPGLLTRPAELAEDAAALRRLAEWCGRYSPWTAPDGSDGIKIEITGSAHLWGGEAELAADLSRRLARQDIAHRLAIADTLGAAWAAARHATDEAAKILARCRLAAEAAGAAGLIVPSGETGGALAPLPVAALAVVSGGQRGLALLVVGFGGLWLYEHRVLGAALPPAYLVLRRGLSVAICVLLALTMFVSDTAGLT